MTDFKPKIVGFCCHYCAFAAGDLAGVSRFQYPPTTRVVRVMCTGRIDTLHLLTAFEEGADGVFVAGCLEGNCHYLEGNLRAKKRVKFAKGLLEEVGVEPERLEMYNLSASMGTRFAEIVREVSERITALGPSPLNKGSGSGAPVQSQEVTA